MWGVVMQAITITLPIDDEDLEFVKYVVKGIMSSFKRDSDRLDVIDTFCVWCGSLDRRCGCRRDC